MNVSIGSDNGLVSNRQQVSIISDDEPDHEPIYASPDFNESKTAIHTAKTLLDFYVLGINIMAFWKKSVVIGEGFKIQDGRR